MGTSCRFCFNDPLAARLADAIAASRGERVIMCDTHEPPVTFLPEEMAPASTTELSSTEATDPPYDIESTDAPLVVDEPLLEDDSQIFYTDDIRRGQLCAFLPGYFEFLGESNLTVRSIQHFMPGMRVAVATSTLDFHVYNR